MDVEPRGVVTVDGGAEGTGVAATDTEIPALFTTLRTHSSASSAFTNRMRCWASSRCADSSCNCRVDGDRESCEVAEREEEGAEDWLAIMR